MLFTPGTSNVANSQYEQDESPQASGVDSTNHSISKSDLASNAGSPNIDDGLDAPEFDVDEPNEPQTSEPEQGTDDQEDETEEEEEISPPKSRKAAPQTSTKKHEAARSKAAPNTHEEEDNSDSAMHTPVQSSDGGKRRRRGKGGKRQKQGSGAFYRTVQEPTKYAEHSVNSSVKAIREKTPTDSSNHGRRSSRQRFKPLAFWKNERPLYQRDDHDEVGKQLPTIKGVLEASVTPVAPKR